MEQTTGRKKYLPEKRAENNEAAFIGKESAL